MSVVYGQVQDSDQQPQRLEASELTPTLPFMTRFKLI